MTKAKDETCYRPKINHPAYPLGQLALREASSISVNPKCNLSNHHIQPVVLLKFCLCSSETHGYLYSLFCLIQSCSLSKAEKKIISKRMLVAQKQNTQDFARRWVLGSSIY